MTNRKIAILGAAGFIGSALVRRFEGKDMGLDVHAFETSSNTNRNHPTRRVWLDGDHHGLVELLRGFDTVYICAGRTGGVGRMARDPLSFVLPNVRIHMNVYETALKAGVRRVVSGQSITGYPNVSWPVNEDEYGAGELHSAYFVPGNTWRFVGKLAEIFSGQGLETVFVRPSNVYGPGNDFDPETSHVIEATVRKVAERQDPFVIWGTGEEKRDPTYIDDLAEAMTRCIDCPPGAYNIGTGQSVSVNEMVQALLAHADFHPEIRYDAAKPSAIPTRYLDCKKARDVLDWTPKVGIEEGLARTYDWFVNK